jgi:hypothetical protein
LGRVVYALNAPQLYELKGGHTQKRMRGITVLAGAGHHISVEGPFLYDEAAAPHSGFWIPG